MIDRTLVIKKNIDQADDLLKKVADIENKTNARLQEARDEAKSIVMRSEHEIKALMEVGNKKIEQVCAALYVESEKEAEKCRNQLALEVPDIVEMLKDEIVQKFAVSNKLKFKG